MDGEVIENALFSDGLFHFLRFMLTKLTVPMQKKTRGNKGLYTIYSEVMGDKVNNLYRAASNCRSETNCARS